MGCAGSPAVRGDGPVSLLPGMILRQDGKVLLSWLRYFPFRWKEKEVQVLPLPM
jgi:hypothetical protein